MVARFFCRVLKKSLLIFVLTVAACVSPSPEVNKPAPPVVKPVFPPQEAMQSGNYGVFLSVNQKSLIECNDEPQCAVALFNLGFIYAYPPSPYYNPSKGLLYFEALVQKYPQNPLTFQAKVWTEFMKKSIASETSKQRLKGELKSKETAIKELQKRVEDSKQVVEDSKQQVENSKQQVEESKQQVEESKQMDMEIDRIEKDLQRQIDRSRQIDVEMERKERELLK